MDDEVGKKNKIDGALGRQANQPRQRARNGDDSGIGQRRAAAAAQQERHAQRFVDHSRKRMRRVDRYGSEQADQVRARSSRRRKPCASSSSSSMPSTRIPCSASSGRSRSFQQEYCSSTNSWVASLISSRSSTMVRPSGVVELWPSSSCCKQAADPDFEKFVQIAGRDGQKLHAFEQRIAESSASSSTRQLNFSHDSSRFKRVRAIARSLSNHTC